MQGITQALDTSSCIQTWKIQIEVIRGDRSYVLAGLEHDITANRDGADKCSVSNVFFDGSSCVLGRALASLLVTAGSEDLVEPCHISRFWRQRVETQF